MCLIRDMNRLSNAPANGRLVDVRQCRSQRRCSIPDHLREGESSRAPCTNLQL